MGLVYKKLEKIGRSMYLYFPEQERRTAFKRCSITILRDGEDEASVRYFLDELGMQKLAEEQEIILSFPNPENGRWNYDFSGETDDLTAFHDFQDAMTKEDDKPLATRPNGIPTYEAMLSVWHPMNDTRYLVGTGSGAHMVCTLAACVAENIAAIFAVGGRLCEEARYQAVNAAVPAFLVDSDRKTQNYFNVVNETEWKETADQITVTRNKRNPSQCVMNSENMQLSKELVNRVWEELFSVTRRTNTSVYGDVEPKPDMKKAGFELYLDDDRLEEKVKVKHTWFVHVPSGVKDGTSGRVSLMLFFHGGSDNPEEAAQMSRFHELGEKEGFITVYPWGTDRTQWNSFLAPDGADDIGYTVALIQYMKEHYPVDPERVYLSGFSNGAGQAQAVAMLHPELIAAICHIDSNWPGIRNGASELTEQDKYLFGLAMEKKKEYDYRMPVWYTYGSREISYPIYYHCSQQHQYDFWKAYNHIRIEETPDLSKPDPSGCGVPGQIQQRIRPSARHPEHYYDVQRFYSDEEHPVNLYNLAMMHDKGHEVADKDPELGWNYVKQFRRLPDGSLKIVSNE